MEEAFITRTSTASGALDLSAVIDQFRVFLVPILEGLTSPPPATSKDRLDASQKTIPGVSSLHVGTLALARTLDVGCMFPREPAGQRPGSLLNMDQLAAGRGALAMGTSWQMHTTKIDDVVLGVDLKWKRQRATPGLDPLAPEGLPACAHETVTRAVGAVPLARFGETLSVRGILTFDGTWACTLKGCENHCCNNCSTSLVVTAADGKGPALRLQRTEDHHPLGLTALECERPEPPSIEVVATGRLSLDDHARPPSRRKSFLLDEVALCAIKTAP